MSSQSILIPARNDVKSWKTLLSKCPHWLLSMEFTKAVTRGISTQRGMNVFTHPSCVAACESVLKYNAEHPHVEKPSE